MSNREILDDKRPRNCRFRLRDEGKPYPRSGCAGCDPSLSARLGSDCNYEELRPNKVLAEKLKAIVVSKEELDIALKDASAYLTTNEKELIVTLTNNLPAIIEALEK